MVQNMEVILRRLSSNDPLFTYLNLSEVDVNDDQLQLIADKLRDNTNINRISWREGSHCDNDLKKQIEDKIASNIQLLQLHPTDFAHGLLSCHVYADSKVGDSVQLQKCEETWNEELRNWRVIEVFSPNDGSRYYSAAYLNEKRKQIVLAHRGTTLKFLDFLNPDSPLKNDLDGILSSKIVSHQKHAFVATKKVIEYAQKEHCSVSFTGHSLGAWLAELSLYHTVYDFEYFESKAVTFDSPGSAPAMENFNSNVKSHETKRDVKNLDITTYLSAPNLVNVCNPRVGNVYRIHPKITWANNTDKFGSGLEKIPKAKKLKPYIMGLLSLVGHFIVPMVATFQSTTGKPVKLERVIDWPCIKFNPASLNTSGKGGHSVFQFIPGFGNLADEAVVKRTYWTVLKVVNQFVNGNVDCQQFFKVYEYLETNAKEGYPLIQTNLPCFQKQFDLLYKAHYRVEILNLSEDLYNENKINDCSLHKLCQIGTDEIDNMVIDAKLKHALKNLKSKYRIETKYASGRKYICAESPDIRVDDLRGEILNLRATRPDLMIKILEHKNAYSPQNGNQSIMIISNLPNLSIHTVERLEVRKKIEEVFRKHKVVIISAFPGFGKSTMAKIYGRYLIENFSNQVVRFIDADCSNKINDEYRQIAEHDLKIGVTNQTAENIMHSVHTHIQRSGLSVLFIFDNVENFEDVKLYLDAIFNLKSCKVIITTRRGNLKNDLFKFKLNPFTKEEAKSYVENSLGGRLSSDNIVNLVDKLSSKEDDLVWPYRLSHGVTYLDQNTICSVEDYIKILEKSDDETGTYLLFDVLKKSKLSWCVLQYSAYLDPDFISTDIFKELFSADKIGLQVSINKLEALGLINLTPSRNGHCGFQIHRLAQDLVIKYVDVNKYVENNITEQCIFEGIIQVLNTLFPTVINSSIENVQMSRILYPHAVKIFKRKIHCNKQAEMSELYDKLGDYTRLICEFAQALKYHKTALEIKQALYRKQNILNSPIPEFPELPVHPGIADSLDSIGLDYCCVDNENDATKDLEYFCAAHKIREELYPGQNHPDIAKSLVNIGRSNGNKGKLWRKCDEKEALKYNEKALDMLQALYPGQNHESIVNALVEVGTSYRHGTDKENSLKYYKEALEMAQALYPEQNHAVTAECLRMVGAAFTENGDASTGVKYMEDALKMTQALNPEQNLPTVCGYLRNISLCYIKAGDEANAIKNSEAGVKMVQALFTGKIHSDVANSFCVLGSAYLKSGYTEKSVEYFKQSYLIDRRIIDGLMAQRPDLTKRVASFLMRSSIKFIKNNETREMIIQRGSFDESVVQIMKNLYKTVLIKIYSASLKGTWSSGYFFGEPSIFGDWGVNGYLNEKYLCQKLGSLSNSETIETAKMLCFEAICLGIMRCKSERRNFKCAEEFAKSYPKTMEKITNDHPEYFIDGSILRQCISDSNILNKLLVNAQA